MDHIQTSLGLEKLFPCWIWKIIVAGIALVIVKWIYRFNNYAVIINKIPGFAAFPFIGNIRLCLNAKLASSETLDLMNQIVLGSNDNSQDNVDSHSILKNMKDSSYYMMRRVLKPWLWLELIYKHTNDGKEFNRVVNVVNKITAKEMGERSRNAIVERENESLLDLLMEKHSEDSTSNLKDVQKELNLFMIAGQDTTHLNLVYTLYLLGLDQKIQGKVYEELSQIFHETNPSITNDEIQRLPYLDMVIKESLRVFPAISAISRKLDEDINIGSYVIPKGTAIVINIFKLHRDPAVFPDPEKFNPDRFAPGKSKNITPFNYMPFSYGPRNCIGKQIATLTVKVLLAHLLLNYQVKSLDPRDKILLSPAITLKSKFPIRLKFHRRNPINS